MQNLWLKILCLIICALSAGAWSAENSKNLAKSDVRLLIDISGSMKKNDPQNLRIPALQLVTNLMPKGADAGVWAFGRYVNMLVPLAQVDKQWQSQATNAAKKINSAGLYTNIGGVLEKASYGWSSPSSDEKRSLILLTDGMVDISKSASANQKERTRILEQVLPKLITAGATIHTIALSQNADHELLKALSDRTDGWYQAVESAEELQKVFLKIFEQSTQRDSLPLENNRFKVDASIEEMTLLVFKSENSDKTRLITPDKTAIEGATSDGNVRWFAAKDYDLVTIETPQPGDWQIEADVDPDNRVMVVSNLRLDVSSVPNNLLSGEAIDYQVALLQDDKPISKPEFIKLVKAQLTQTKNGQSSRLAMFYDGSESRFKQNFFTDNYEGILNLQLIVRSPTFERTRNHAVNIYGSPLIPSVNVSDTIEQSHEVSFSIRQDIVKPETVTVMATVELPNGEKQFIGLEDLTQPIKIPFIALGGEYSVTLDIKGQSITGREFSVSPEPIVFNAEPLIQPAEQQEAPPEVPVVDIKQPEVEAQAEQPKVEPVNSDKQESADTNNSETDSNTETEPETDWTFWIYIGIGVNLLLGVGGFFAWKLVKKKNQQSALAVADELALDEEDDEDSEDAEADEEQEEDDGYDEYEDEEETKDDPGAKA
ncbi:VWA domain-containing protein [Aliikangiella sp. IMCC44632]